MTLTLTRKLVVLMLFKLAALAAIYMVAFARPSHASHDVAAHIGGAIHT
jgi:hypothetical protein